MNKIILLLISLIYVPACGDKNTSSLLSSAEPLEEEVAPETESDADDSAATDEAEDLEEPGEDTGDADAGDEEETATSANPTAEVLSDDRPDNGRTSPFARFWQRQQERRENRVRVFDWGEGKSGSQSEPYWYLHWGLSCNTVGHKEHSCRYHFLDEDCVEYESEYPVISQEFKQHYREKMAKFRFPWSRRNWDSKSCLFYFPGSGCAN